MHKSITVLLLVAGAMAASNALAQAPRGDDRAVPASTPAVADAPPTTSPPAAERSMRADLEAEMRALQERLAVLAREYAALRGAAPVSNAASLADLLAWQNADDGSGDIESRENRLRELEIERDQLTQRYSEQHPALRSLERQIEAMRTQIAAWRAAEAVFGPPEGDEARELDRATAVAPLATAVAPRASVVATEASREAPRARPGAVQDEVRRLRSDAEQEEQRRRAVELAEQQEQQRLRAVELEARSRVLSEGLGSLFGNTLRYSTTVWDTMQLVTLTPQLGEYFGTESGILVLRAPADESLGLRDGDVILDIGGRTPTSPEHTLRILSSFVPGETLTLGIMRSGRRETREIVLPQVDSETPAARNATPAPPQPTAAPPTPQRPQQRQPALDGAGPGNGAIF